jgi:hypothetical protein
MRLPSRCWPHLSPVRRKSTWKNAYNNDIRAITYHEEIVPIPEKEKGKEKKSHVYLLFKPTFVIYVNNLTLKVDQPCLVLE